MKTVTTYKYDDKGRLVEKTVQKVVEAAQSKPRYREVGRFAEVGEKIKIVSARGAHGLYKTGDVLTVRSLYPGSNFGSVYVKEFNVPHICSPEYVVLEEIT